jgi:hypothetical protein
MDYKWLLLVGILLSSPAFGDTVRLTDKTTWNGRVAYNGSSFTLKARFPGETQRTLQLTREQIERIEINENDYNQGSPPEWLSASSITGCLIGSPANEIFLVVPTRQPVAIQVIGKQDFRSSVGKSVTLSGSWQVAGKTPDSAFQVNSISSPGLRCDDSAERSAWKKLLEEETKLTNEKEQPIRDKKLGRNIKSEGACTLPIDAVVLLDDAKHEGCLSEISDSSVSLMSDKKFPRKKVRVVVLGR